MISRALIQETALRIVDQFKPERIVLFGSYAYGDPSVDSDVDLLITMQTRLRPIDQAVQIRQAIRFPFPVDLLIRTPEQIRKRLDMGDPFISKATSMGKILYESHHPRVA